MESTTRIRVQADPDVVFALAAAVEDWPRLLPHYRRARGLRRHGGRPRVARAADRDGSPVRWMAIQELHPAERRITFRHVGGATRGMEVAWTLRPDGDAV